MTRQFRTPFDPSRPVYCKWDGIYLGTKKFSVEERVDWKERGADIDRIRIMYNQGMLYHNDELDYKDDNKIIGDGLAQLSLDDLAVLVKKINEKVKAKYTGRDRAIRLCPMSKIKDKQIGLIRRWRSIYGEIEG